MSEQTAVQPPIEAESEIQTKAAVPGWFFDDPLSAAPPAIPPGAPGSFLQHVLSTGGSGHAGAQATIARQATELQQTHGNQYVQRLFREATQDSASADNQHEGLDAIWPGPAPHLDPDERQDSGERGKSSLARPRTPMRSVEQPSQIRRETVDGVDNQEALAKAIQLANERNLLSIAVPLKPPGKINAGPIEIKSVDFKADVKATASGPAPKTDTSVSGKQATSPTDATARIYAADIKHKMQGLVPEQLRNDIDASWTIASATIAPDAPPTISSSFTVKGTTVPLSPTASVALIKVNPKETDLHKRYEVVPITLSVSKSVKFESSDVIVAGTTVPLNITVTFTGSAVIGPDWEKAIEYVGRKFGRVEAQKFYEANLKLIAHDSADVALERTIRHIVEDSVKDISDPGIKEAARAFAEDAARAAVDKEKLTAELLDVGRKAVTSEGATEVLDAARAMAAVRRAAGEAATSVAREVAGGLSRRVATYVRTLSIKEIAKRAGEALIPGPADFVLMGAELVWGYMRTIMIVEDIEDAPVRAVRMADNYVAGYVAGLKGGAKGAGESGGGNVEGQAYLLGVNEGTMTHDKYVDQAMALTDLGEPVKREDVDRETGAYLASQPIDRGSIVAAAQPRLTEMAKRAFIEEHSGILDTILGFDIENSKDLEMFLFAFEHGFGDDLITVANLANGVKIRLSQIRGGWKGARWLTPDRVHTVLYSADDPDRYSGWQTIEGQPLEEIYQSQDDAGASTDVEQHFQKTMRGYLARSKLNVYATFSGGSGNLSVSLSKPDMSDEDEYKFDDWLRTAPAQSLTVRQAGLRWGLTGRITGGSPDPFVRYDAYTGVLELDHERFTIPPDWVKTKFPSIDTEASGAARSVADALISGLNMDNKTLASLPSLR